MKEIILKKTIELANDTVMMDSYKAFYQGKGYFLTKNPNLNNKNRKPSKFAANERVFEKW